jgi:methyl-accepting chemotaxis protein
MSNATLEKTLVANDAGGIDENRGEENALSVMRVDLRASLSVLPVVAAQLREVSKHVEESVVKVCENFHEMIQRARQATSQVPMIGKDSVDRENVETVGIDQLISGTRGTMADLLERIERTSGFTGTMVDRLNAVEHQIEELNETLCDIDTVASKSGLLALNGQLEAARAGEQGAAFAIVATETAKMAVHAVASSKKIRKMIQSVSQSISGASAELKDRAATDIREAALSRKEVDTSLDTMASLHDDMQNTLERSNANAEQLARNISEAVVALQFQDAVSQRIEHVVHALLEMHDEFQKRLDGNENDSSTTSAEDWASRMAKKYTMASEHRVLASHRLAQDEIPVDSGNNVELF